MAEVFDEDSMDEDEFAAFEAVMLAVEAVKAFITCLCSILCSYSEIQALSVNRSNKAPATLKVLMSAEGSAKITFSPEQRRLVRFWRYSAMRSVFELVP